MAIFENGTLTKPVGSAVQVEALPEVNPPKGFTETDGAYATRLAAWGARTRTITFTIDDGSLLGVKQTTAALAFTATAAAIEAALVALGAIADGDVMVNGASRKFTYSFGGAYANKPVKVMYSTLDGVVGKTNYFEVIQDGASEASQQAAKQAMTEFRLGITREDYANENRAKPADIGDPARYNADGSPNQR